MQRGWLTPPQGHGRGRAQSLPEKAWHPAPPAAHGAQRTTSGSPSLLPEGRFWGAQESEPGGTLRPGGFLSFFFAKRSESSL